MAKKRSCMMTGTEAACLETVVRELLLKAMRKRKPFTPEKLDIAVADGVGRIMLALRMYYPDIQEDE